MSDQATVERADLQKKDKSELQTIVGALGGKATSRAKKSDLIDQILVLSGVITEADLAGGDAEADAGDAPAAASDAAPSDDAAESDESAGSDEADDSDAVDSDASDDDAADDDSDDDASDDDAAAEDASDDDSAGDNSGGGGASSRSSRNRGRRRRGGNAEPPAEWETELEGDSGNKGGRSKNDNDRGSDNRRGNKSDNRSDNKQDNNRSDNNNRSDKNDNRGGSNDQGGDDEIEPGNRRRRRRGRSRDRDDAPAALEAAPVSGYLDLRDDGYGFLRVAGWMQTKDDVYVSVKMVRQNGLRKGDLVVGTARPASRNEKNPAMDTIETINDMTPEEARQRPLFEELTPLFPDERLQLELTREPLQMTPRIVDLVSPIGKGQRGLIVSPPKAGKTTIMKDIAKSIEKNNPEVHLVVLLIDERPEEVTDMERSLEHGEVAASTFDRPPEEHCALAELTIERAKRMVEAGEDVVIILDGITRLARAYNMGGPTSGRLMSGGLDTAAIYPPKRFFGAARNLEEGGSLTILATALVETGSRMDEVIFEEFKGTGNMELRLDRRLAEKRIFPAIDIDGSSTRRDELLQTKAEKNQGAKLRRVLSGMAESDEGSGAAGLELLTERLKTFKTNEAFLAELAKNG